MKCGTCGVAQLSDQSRFCHQCGAPFVPAATAGVDPLVGKIVGNYQVLAVIGQGGMGRVYRAEQVRLRRPVCLKTLLPQFAQDESLVQRFEREGVATAAMRHPNIVSVFDFGRTDDGTLYIVMELIEGKTLRAILREEAPLPVARAIGLMGQVLAALDEAHAQSVVHRDLKPSNVLVSKLRDGSDLVKVVDFGIAKIVGGDDQRPGLTRTGMMVGSMGYMAPEQLLGKEIDGRADLYSAGVILWELLTGRKLFSARSEQQSAEAHLLQEAASPSTASSQPIPPALDSAVLRALEKAPERRFKSAPEFRAQLDAIRLSLEGGSTTRPSVLQQDEASTPVPGQAVVGPELRKLAGVVPEKLLGWATALPALAAQKTRRPLTVAMVEVLGLSRLSSGRDPAEVKTIVTTLMLGMVSAVEGAGGHARRLAGNSLVALFGLTEVREDDAARALFAASGMRGLAQRVPGLSLSIGVHLEHVVSGGYDDPLEDPAIGDVMAASRRLANAAGGAVLVTQPVQRAAGSRLRFKERAAVQEAGKPVVEFLGDAEVLASSEPMAGRRAELETLRALTGAIAQGGAGGLMLVAGPGLGKSRLLDELESLGRAKGLTIARARGGRFATAPPYDTLRELVQALNARPNLEGAGNAPLVGLTRFGLSSVDLSRLERVFGRAQRPDTESGGEEEVLVDRALLLSVLQRAAKLHPLLLIVDDAHLADRVSLEVLERLIASAGTYPLGLVVAARPQSLETLLPKLRRFELRPLDAAELASLLALYLPGGRPTPELLEFVADRSQGNPLFACEIILALTEQGALERRGNLWALNANAALPDSVALVIASRLARLTPNARLFATWGAVAGRTFEAALIANAVDAPLDVARATEECVRRELLEPAQRSASAYSFRQLVVYEQVLAQLPPLERRHIHLRLAESLERGVSGGTENPLEAMARHFRAADRPRKALKYLRAAADQLFDRRMLAAAAEAYQECLQLVALDLPKVGAAPDAVVQTWLEVGARAVESLVGTKAKSASELAARVLAVGGPTQALAARAEALRQKALALAQLSRPAEAEAALLEARALGESTADLGFMISLNANLATVLEARGELAKAAELLVAGLQSLGTKRGVKHGGQLWQYLNQLGRIHLRLAKFEQAQAYFENARTQAKAVESEVGEAKALVNLAVLAAGQKDGARALLLLEEALELSEKNGDGIARVRIHHNRGLVRRARGEAGPARADFELAATEARELGWREGEALAMQALAQLTPPATPT